MNSKSECVKLFRFNVSTLLVCLCPSLVHGGRGVLPRPYHSCERPRLERNHHHSSHANKTKQCYIVQALLMAGTARHQRRMSTHSKRLTRKGTAVPCSPATLGLGKIPNTFSNTVSGPSRSSNTKFFTRIESTIYKCTYIRQSLTGASPINRGREWTYLELGDRKPLSKTCPRAVDESQQMPVPLDLFRPARNAVVADPPFRFELFGVRTPQRRRAVHGRH